MHDEPRPFDLESTTSEEAPSEASTPRRSRRGGGVTGTIGGALVAFDEQVWRNQPPAHELVEHARPDPSVPASDGGRITLSFPAILPGGRVSVTEAGSIGPLAGDGPEASESAG
jgi:hypothetical protein